MRMCEVSLKKTMLVRFCVSVGSAKEWAMDPSTLAQCDDRFHLCGPWNAIRIDIARAFPFLLLLFLLV